MGFFCEVLSCTAIIATHHAILHLKYNTSIISAENNCWIYEVLCRSSTHTDVRLQTHTRLHAVKDRVTRCERKHSHYGIHGTINEVMTLYIYLQVIRIQGPRNHILSLPRLSKEHSFCLVYITKRKIKSWH